MFESSEAFINKVSGKQPAESAESAVPWALILQSLLPIILNCFNAPQSLSEAKSAIENRLGRAACRRCCRRAEREQGRRFSRSEREEFIDALESSLNEISSSEFDSVCQELQVE